MSTGSSVAKKSKRHQRLFVLIVTVILILVIFYVGYKGRFIFILPGIGFLIGALSTCMLLCQVFCELISRRWPKVIGLVRCVKIVRSLSSSGDSSPAYDYSIEVEYDYVVADKRYKGTRVSFVGKDYNSWKAADVARHHFLHDKNVNVYYCPLIPSCSCITHIQPRDIVITLSAVATFTAVAFILTMLAFYYLP